MQLIISARDQVLVRYGNALAMLGEGQARTALSRALNHEGNKRAHAGQARLGEANRDQVRRDQQGGVAVWFGFQAESSMISATTVEKPSVAWPAAKVESWPIERLAANPRRGLSR